MKHAVLIGRMVDVAEIKATTTGLLVANFSVAISDYKIVNGERHEYANFFNCTAFDKIAELLQQFVKKATKLFFFALLNRNAGRIKIQKRHEVR